MLWKCCTQYASKFGKLSSGHSGVITQLEPDILECEVKWALQNITTNKASGSDGIPPELFQILKDDAVKVLPSNLEISAAATGLEKVSVHSNPKERQRQRMLKLPHNSSVQSLSRVQLCDPMNRSTPGLPVHHQLPEFTQTQVH